MTDIEKLSLLRVMTEKSEDDEGWSDEVLFLYLTIAGQKILNRAYPYDNAITTVPVRYGYLQCEIANYLLNKRGAEGQTAHSENGVNRSYESADIPESMLSEVVPHVEVF